MLTPGEAAVAFSFWLMAGAQNSIFNCARRPLRFTVPA